MAEYDDLLADLPAPNPEEPASLRDDIADELKDHLQCAARREAVSHPDPEDVENRVLARFGNPQKIARRLWFDWMKEILMTQKITLALVAIVAVASLGACGLMWSFARDFQAASAELLTQGRDANRELLKQNRQMMEKLTTLTNREAERVTSREWNPVKIRVVKDDKDQTVAEGFDVTLRGNAHTAAEKITLKEKSDSKGFANFGLVRPGTYSVQVDTPWGEYRHWEIVVKPGTTYSEEVVCPTGPLEAVAVQPIVNWPDELRDLPVALVVKVQRTSNDRTQIGEEIWYDGTETYLLVRPNGRFATYSDVDLKYGLAGNVAPVRFHGKPQEYTDSFPWRGRAARLSDFKIVFLPTEKGFPANLEVLTGLSPSHNLRRYLYNYPKFHEILAERHSEAVVKEVSKETTETWRIEIARLHVLNARAMLASEEFPDLRGHKVQIGALHFLVLDTDGNKQFTQEEFSQKAGLHGLDFQQFPVSWNTFIERYVETGKSSVPDNVL